MVCLIKEEEWQVAAQKDKYVVRKIVREKGATEWIEREFAWRVDVKEKSIRVISLAAQQFMPFENLPPLPHQEEISFLPRTLETARTIWIVPSTIRTFIARHVQAWGGIFLTRCQWGCGISSHATDRRCVRLPWFLLLTGRQHGGRYYLRHRYDHPH